MTAAFDRQLDSSPYLFQLEFIAFKHQDEKPASIVSGREFMASQHLHSSQTNAITDADASRYLSSFPKTFKRYIDIKVTTPERKKT